MDANTSPARWMDVPLPAEAYVSLPGSRRAWASTSLTDLSLLRAGLTTSTLGTSASRLTGVKSFTGS